MTAFIAALWERGLAPSTVERRVAAVKGLHKFLVREGITDNHPTARLPLPKVPERLPEVISIEEIDRFLGQPFPDSPAGLRDRAMLETLYGCGLRVSELTGLDLAGVDLGAGYVRVFGKGGKERVVPIAGMAAHALDAYLRHGRPYLRPKSSLRGRRRLGGVRERAGRPALSAGGVRNREGLRRAGRARRCTPTRCGIRSRRTCSRAARTCVRCRRCSATRTSRRHRSTRTLTGATFARNTSRRTLARACAERVDRLVPSADFPLD